MTRQKEQEDQAEKTREEIGKGNQMTALRFQTGDVIRHPWLPFGSAIQIPFWFALLHITGKIQVMTQSTRQGGMDRSAVEHWTCDGKVKGTVPCSSSGRIFFSMVNFLCGLYCRISSTPWSQLFWQVTAKHVCTLCMWLWIELKTLTWLCGAYRTCTEVAAVLLGTSHVTTKQFCKYPFQWLFKNVLHEATVTH